MKKRSNGNLLVVCLYVDDVIYLGSCESIVSEFKSCIMSKFEMYDFGILHYFLELEVRQG